METIKGPRPKVPIEGRISKGEKPERGGNGGAFPPLRG